MTKQNTLQLIYGADYDLVDPRKHKTFATVPDDLRFNLWRVGLCGSFHDLALTMLQHRFSLQRVIPCIAELAREMGRCRRHISGMVAVLEQHDLLKVERPKGPRGPVKFDISPLISKVRALLKRKRESAPADKLPSRLPPKAEPKPKPAPMPLPVPAPEPKPAPPDEDEIAAPVAEPDASVLWRQMVSRLAAKTDTSQQHWFTSEHLQAREYTGGLLLVAVPDGAYQTQLQTRFAEKLEAELQAIEPGATLRFYFPKPRPARLVARMAGVAAAALPGVG